jgi:hypothetical protein
MTGSVSWDSLDGWNTEIIQIATFLKDIFNAGAARPSSASDLLD